MNNAILKYYFDKSGLPLDLMNKKVSPNFSKFLSGKKKPTFNQLEKIAKLFDIPVGLLLINETVNKNISELKFRTINSDALSSRSAELTDTINEMQEKQDFLKSQIDYELNYIGKFTIKSNYLDVVKYIRKLLDLKQDYYLHVSQHNQLRFLRSKINHVGVFVFFNGKIGDNTHRSLSVDEFRGFVLSDKKAPIIFINQKDTKNGQVFTLIHEFTHLLINDNEVLGQQHYLKDYDSVEAFVNKVTAEILVPKDNLVTTYRDEKDIDNLATTFKVSRFVIARRLFDIKKINHKKYVELVAKFKSEFENLQKNQTHHSGGNYRNNLNFRIDHNFFRFVENALNRREISYTDAFNIIGVGYKGYEALKGE